MICKISESLELFWGKNSENREKSYILRKSLFCEKIRFFYTFGQILNKYALLGNQLYFFCIPNHKNQLYNTYNQVIKLLLVIYDHFKLNFRPIFGQICTVIGYILAKFGFTFHAITFEPFLFRTWLTPHFNAER